ncbi:MAG: hypothetical protein LBJ09_01960 [Clostridiales bacterium]|nr:hypothetical protein [Clostridiales bacterium]
MIKKFKVPERIHIRNMENKYRDSNPFPPADREEILNLAFKFKYNESPYWKKISIFLSKLIFKKKLVLESLDEFKKFLYEFNFLFFNVKEVQNNLHFFVNKTESEAAKKTSINFKFTLDIFSISLCYFNCLEHYFELLKIKADENKIKYFFEIVVPIYLQLLKLDENGKIHPLFNKNLLEISKYLAEYSEIEKEKIIKYMCNNDPEETLNLQELENKNLNRKLLIINEDIDDDCEINFLSKYIAHEIFNDKTDEKGFKLALILEKSGHSACIEKINLNNLGEIGNWEGYEEILARLIGLNFSEEDLKKIFPNLKDIKDFAQHLEGLSISTRSKKVKKIKALELSYLVLMGVMSSQQALEYMETSENLAGIPYIQNPNGEFELKFADNVSENNLSSLQIPTNVALNINNIPGVIHVSDDTVKEIAEEAPEDSHEEAVEEIAEDSDEETTEEKFAEKIPEVATTTDEEPNKSILNIEKNEILEKNDFNINWTENFLEMFFLYIKNQKELTHKNVKVYELFLKQFFSKEHKIVFEKIEHEIENIMRNDGLNKEEKITEISHFMNLELKKINPYCDKTTVVMFLLKFYDFLKDIFCPIKTEDIIFKLKKQTKQHTKFQTNENTLANPDKTSKT